MELSYQYSDMPSLTVSLIRSSAQGVEAIGNIAEQIPWWFAAATAPVVILTVLDSVAPWTSTFGSMPPTVAVTMLATIGGVGGFLSQLAASYNFEQVGAPIHILEIIPAVIMSIGASVAAILLFTPPRFTFGITEALANAGYLPRSPQ